VKPGLSTLVSDAWRLWRADWNILLSMAGPFLFLPPLVVNLLLSPDLDRAMSAIAPNDGAARMEAFSSWMQGALPWLVLAQAVIQFGSLAILTLYLDRDRPAVGEALRTALRRLPLYLLAMILTSIVSFAGLFVLIVGYFYALARLSMTGPVLVAERQANPIAAIGRSLQLTRGSGLILMAIMLFVYGATFFIQAPFEQIQEWMATHAPNPIAEAVVGILVSALSGCSFLAIGLVQVAAYRRFTASSTSYRDIVR